MRGFRAFTRKESSIKGRNFEGQTLHGRFRPVVNPMRQSAPSPDFSGEGSQLVEAGGQLFHPFRDRLDYAFILHRFRDGSDAGRVIGSLRCRS